MSSSNRKRRRDQELQAKKIVKKMPRPRMGDDPLQYIERARRWTEQVERDHGGEQELLSRVEELAGPEMEAHLNRHLLASTITTPAADELLRSAGVSAQILTNAHLSEYWQAPENRSCVPLGAGREEVVVVSYSSEAARTRIWRLGEGEHDPSPGTVEEWRRGR